MCRPHQAALLAYCYLDKPDLDLATANGPLRTFTLLHHARPLLLNLKEPGRININPWADWVPLINAKCLGVSATADLAPTHRQTKLVQK